jgi:hypothetical protein
MGYWQMTLHPTLLADGKKLLSVPEMVVYHRGPFHFRYYLRQRYLFSRAFAGVRARNQGGLRRWAYVFRAPLVPLVLLARISRTVITKRCRVGKFIVALPLLTIALLVLVAGEWVGCVLGPDVLCPMWNEPQGRPKALVLRGERRAAPIG